MASRSLAETLTKPAALVATVIPVAAWGQGPPPNDAYPYGPHMMAWGGWYGPILGPLFMVLLLAAAVAFAAVLVRWIGGPWGTPPPHHGAGRTALDILKERYARGEIDKQEFEERRRVIGE